MSQGLCKCINSLPELLSHIISSMSYSGGLRKQREVMQQLRSFTLHLVLFARRLWSFAETC